MSFENDRWRNIKREHKIFRRPHGENSQRTDALAVAMPPNTSTLEMLRGCSDSAEIQPHNNE
jgi:hypothetical protein